MIRQLSTLVLLLVLLAAARLAPATGPRRLPRACPAEVGMQAAHLAPIDEVVAEGLAAEEMPGCVVLVARHGKIVLLKAYGFRQIQPARIEMTTDTVFDLASLTKPIATATSVMILLEQGRLRLRAPLARYIPEFGAGGKQDVTVQQLLTHQGGLVPDNSLDDYAAGPEEAWRRIFALEPQVEPGTRFVYSDVGFLVLGELVRRISGADIHRFSHEHIFEPLGMAETGFLPPAPLRQRAAPTERRDGRWMLGEVHDPRAYRLGGVAGHAGLFSTADDLAIFAQMMLGRGSYGNVQILSPQTVRRMTAAYPVSSGLRGLGWDVRTGYSSNRGELLSTKAFGHGGFTGTALWIDPGLDLLVIFLSNRLHPNGKGNVNPLAGRLGSIAAASIRDCAAAVPAKARTVRTGIDVLEQNGFASLRGKTVGLITNHTGIDRAGTSTAQLLLEAPDVHLKALFSPEHGYRGKLDQARIANNRDEQTELPIYSLYGAARRPTPESLAGLDALVFDIQDVGTRFYTYISTMGLAMEEAARNQVAFVVLDRPNPIGGCVVAGPVLDAGKESFVGYHRLPIRHGMTVGELAQMFRAERRLALALTVIPVEGWARRDLWPATGLRWVNPSPNMRSVTQALLYPGVGLLETTNLSVGRGTDTPFEVFGAPWVDADRLARELNGSGLPGVRFVPVAFTPDASKFRGQECRGVNLVITRWDRFEPVTAGLEIARTLHALFPDDWEIGSYARLLGNAAAFQALASGGSVAAIRSAYQADLEKFRRRRARYLIYKDFNPPAAGTAAVAALELAFGAAGPAVEDLQRTLNARLSPSPNLGVDGDFGPATQAAVIRFQRQHHITANGVVGPATWQALGPLVTQDEPVPPPQVVNEQKLPRLPADTLDGPPHVTCRAWAIADGKTGTVEWGHNEDEPLDIASVTKIMTAYVVVRQAERAPAVLDEEVVFSERADKTEGSTAGVRTGERLPVRELLYGLLLPSGNDASVALAEHFGGRFEPPPENPQEKDPLPRFLAEMNRAAAELGMTHSRFRNTHGLTEEGHVSTCRDLLRLAWTAMQQPLFRNCVSTRQHGYQVTGPGGYRRNLLWKNSNRLLPISGYDGIKTGTTQAAGACLVSSGHRGSDHLLMAVLGAAASDARYTDTRNLFRWAWRQRAAAAASSKGRP